MVLTIKKERNLLRYFITVVMVGSILISSNVSAGLPTFADQACQAAVQSLTSEVNYTVPSSDAYKSPTPYVKNVLTFGTATYDVDAGVPNPSGQNNTPNSPTAWATGGTDSSGSETGRCYGIKNSKGERPKLCCATYCYNNGWRGACEWDYFNPKNHVYYQLG